jgi:hypothetical protein
MGRAGDWTSLKTAFGPLSILNRDRLLAPMRGAQSKSFEVVVKSTAPKSSAIQAAMPSSTTAAADMEATTTTPARIINPPLLFFFYDWTMWSE